ncbi:MAG: radical SAM protein [Candidatus Sericytochromatia bacterium]
MKPIIVGLVQMNQRFFDQRFLPYSVALLQAQVLAQSRHPQRYLFLLPLFQIEAVEKSVEKLLAADIVAFSVYVWNIQRSLAVAAALKKIKPEIWIVFGGPQVPDRAEAFLRQHPQVDLCCHGPGEALFVELLDAYPQRPWHTLPGVSFIEHSQQYVHVPRAPWKRDLAEIASPYLSGVLDPLLAAFPDERWIASWETNRGCPFSCSFCDWGSATGSKVLRFPLERLNAEIAWFSQRQIHSLFCCDANFGMLQRDEELIAEIVAQHKQTGFPTDVHTQSAKNATEKVYRIQTILSENGLSRGATLSFQSLSPGALQAIQRENISLGSYQELQKRFKAAGVPTYTDLLIGVPGETLASFAQGLEAVIRGGQHEQVRFYEISLLPNAPMAQPEYRKTHQLETLFVPAVIPWGPLEDWQKPFETYELVVGSTSFSRSDWAQMRILAWLTDLLYFYQRALQLPLLLLMEIEDLSLVHLLQQWQSLKAETAPLSHQIHTFLQERVAGILRGEPLYSPGPAIPGQPEKIWLSAVNLVYHGLIENHLLDRFFDEATDWLLREWQALPAPRLPQGVLAESLEMARSQFKACYQLPHQPLQGQWNLAEVYAGLLRGESPPLKPRSALLTQ